MEWAGHDDMMWREAVGIHLHLGAVCHLSAGHKGHYFNAHMRRYEIPKTRIEFYNLCQHGNSQPGEPEDKPSEWHLPLICRYGGSLAGAIQIATMEGYGPLYLIGCDLGFKEGKTNHFNPDYAEGARKLPADFLNMRALWAHNVAFRSCPVPIYNCTPGGELDVYPRISLEEVLYGTRLQPRQGELDGTQLDRPALDPPPDEGSRDRREVPAVREGGEAKAKGRGYSKRRKAEVRQGNGSDAHEAS
jgi:hypothetical protein